MHLFRKYCNCRVFRSTTRDTNGIQYETPFKRITSGSCDVHTAPFGRILHAHKHTHIMLTHFDFQYVFPLRISFYHRFVNRFIFTIASFNSSFTSTYLHCVHAFVHRDAMLLVSKRNCFVSMIFFDKRMIWFVLMTIRLMFHKWYILGRKLILLALDVECAAVAHCSKTFIMFKQWTHQTEMSCTLWFAWYTLCAGICA